MNTTFKMQVSEKLIILSALWNFENLVDCLRCNALLAYVKYSRHSSPSSLKCLLFLKTKNANAIENCENLVFWKVIKMFWHQKISALLLSSMSVQKYNYTDDEEKLYALSTRALECSPVKNEKYLTLLFPILAFNLKTSATKTSLMLGMSW